MLQSQQWVDVWHHTAAEAWLFLCLPLAPQQSPCCMQCSCREQYQLFTAVPTLVPVCLLVCCSDQAIRLVRKVHPHTASVLRSLSTSASTSSLA